MDEKKDEGRAFRVTDRRRFSESGEVREDAPPEERRDVPVAGEAEREGPAHHDPQEPVTFSTFLLGLSTQVLLHLGEIPNPVTSAVEPDLEAAKQVIDILGMLRDKTRNNLEPGEESLLDSVLYDLRMRYVELVRKQSKEGT
jgi:Domain of unknown function (DUF1844)